ncbi:MAG: hypothetical protein QM611_06965 [Microbacterium sp.]|uniref:hypothetical protein n=1 Tax=Microbacterium sp. TaxID=51671 RepID=UPI0039E2597B
MPRPSRPLLACGLATLVVALSGCTGSTGGEPVPTATHVDLSSWGPESGNGVTLLSGPGARAEALEAMRDAGAVEMTGRFRDARGERVDIEFAGSPAAFEATFTASGDRTHIVAAGDRAYVRPSPAIAAEASLDPDAYACVGLDDPLVTRWGSMLDPVELVTELTVDAASLGSPADGSVDVILGQEGTSGALTISTTGAPLPLRLVRADDEGELDVEFAGWGEPAAAATPAPLAAGC